MTSVSQVAVKSAQLSWSSRPIRGVAPAFSTRMSGRTSARMRWAAASSVTSAAITATPSLCSTDCERDLVAGDDRHLGALVNQGLDQPEAKASASAGDNDSLVFEAHGLSSSV